MAADKARLIDADIAFVTRAVGDNMGARVSYLRDSLVLKRRG